MTVRRPTQGLKQGLTLAVTCSVLVVSGPAMAEDADSDTAAVEKDRSNPPPFRAPLDIVRAWNLNWRAFAADAMVFENRYVIVPRFDRRFPTSAGLSAISARGRLLAEVGDSADTAALRRRYRPPAEEVKLFGTTLPRLGLGQYGMIHSVEVLDVLGPTSMLVGELWLIDADAVRATMREEREEAERRNRELDRDAQELDFFVRASLANRQRDRAYRGPFRLEGFPTRGLSPGHRYRGPNLDGLHIIVAFVEVTETRRRRSRGRGVLIPVDTFVRSGGLTEAQFADLLDDRGLTPASFLHELRAARDADRSTAEDVILDRLLPPIPEG